MSSFSSNDSSDTDPEVLPIPLVPTGSGFIPAPAAPGHPGYIMAYPAGTPGGQVQFVFAQAPPQIPVRRRMSDRTARSSYSEVQRRRQSRSFRSTGHEDEESDHRETGYPSRRSRKGKPHPDTELVKLVKSLRDDLKKLQNKFDSLANSQKLGTGTSPRGGSTDPAPGVEDTPPTSHQQKNCFLERRASSEVVTELDDPQTQSRVSTLKDGIDTSIPVKESNVGGGTLNSNVSVTPEPGTNEVTAPQRQENDQVEHSILSGTEKKEQVSKKKSIGASIPIQPLSPPIPPPLPSEEALAHAHVNAHKVTITDATSPQQTEVKNGSSGSESSKDCPPNPFQIELLAAIASPEKNLKKVEPKPFQKEAKSTACTADLTYTLKRMRKSKKVPRDSSIPEETNNDIPKETIDSILEEPLEIPAWKKALVERNKRKSLEKSQEIRNQVDSKKELEEHKYSEDDNKPSACEKVSVLKIALRKKQPRPKEETVGANELEQKLNWRRTIINESGISTLPEDIPTRKNQLDEKKKRKSQKEHGNTEKISEENKENAVPSKPPIPKKSTTLLRNRRKILTSIEGPSCSKAEANSDNPLKSHNLKAKGTTYEKNDPISKLDGKDVCELSVKQQLTLLHGEKAPKSKPLESRDEKVKADYPGDVKEKIDSALEGKDVYHMSVKDKIRLLHRENLPKNKIPSETIAHNVEVGNIGNEVQVENHVEISPHDEEISFVLTENECIKVPGIKNSVFFIPVKVQKITSRPPPAAVIRKSMQKIHPKEAQPDSRGEENAVEEANHITTLPTSTPPPAPPPPQVEVGLKPPPKQDLSRVTNSSPNHLGALLNDIRNHERNLRKVSENEKKQKPLTDDDRIKAAIGKRASVMRRESDDENEPRSDPEGDWSD